MLVLLAWGCRCVPVCVGRNGEAAELARAAFPRSVHVGTVDELRAESFAEIYWRAGPLIWCSSGEVRPEPGQSRSFGLFKPAGALF